MKEAKELIAKYQLCETSPEEEEQLLGYLEQDPSHAEELRKADFSFAAALMHGKRKGIRPWIAGLAAGLAAAAIMGAIFLPPRHSAPQPAENPALAQTVVEASPSQSRLTLPDGSIVMLKIGSTLSYGDGFGKSDRDVVFHGEGCFDVVHDASLPFIVKAEGVQVKVVGTVFQVKALPDSPVETTLASGAVQLITDAGSEPAELHPGEKGIVNPGDGSVNIAPANSWEELMDNYGMIVMHDSSLSEICRVIENVFNVRTEIRVGGQPDTVATFGFSKSSDPGTVVELLSMITSNTILIKK